MTPEERANEVCYAVTGEDWGRSIESAALYRSLYPVVLAKITEAYAKGWNAAREKAARLAEAHSSNDELLHEAFKIVAERIRRLEPGA